MIDSRYIFQITQFNKDRTKTPLYDWIHGNNPCTINEIQHPRYKILINEANDTNNVIRHDTIKDNAV